MADTNAESQKIVAEMIARLRELQGSGEYPPLGRKVAAGPGLEGGGTLESDITLELGKQERDTLAAIGGLKQGDVLTRDMVDGLHADMLASVAPTVFYRDFTVMEPPMAAVDAPPVRVDNAATITRITVVAGLPGKQPVNVTVAGQAVTLNAGVESTSRDVSIARSAGQTLPVKIQPTDASRIVVSVRLEEPGVRE